MHNISEVAVLKMELDPAELLEEMLKRGEQAVFPVVRKCVERFVDIINHRKVQQKMQDKLMEIEQKKHHFRKRSIAAKKRVRFMRNLSNSGSYWRTG
jgi:5-formyltetrahydrofolate cyclo-ligase